MEIFLRWDAKYYIVPQNIQLIKYSDNKVLIGYPTNMNIKLKEFWKQNGRSAKSKLQKWDPCTCLSQISHKFIWIRLSTFVPSTSLGASNHLRHFQKISWKSRTFSLSDYSADVKTRSSRSALASSTKIDNLKAKKLWNNAERREAAKPRVKRTRRQHGVRYRRAQ